MVLLDRWGHFLLEFLIFWFWSWIFTWSYKFYATQIYILLTTALEAGRHKAAAILILFRDRLSNEKTRKSIAFYLSSKASGECTAVSIHNQLYSSRISMIWIRFRRTSTFADLSKHWQWDRFEQYKRLKTFNSFKNFKIILKNHNAKYVFTKSFPVRPFSGQSNLAGWPL